MVQAVLIALVRIYQRTLSVLLRGAFGPVCRFEPSCSSYALACLRDHGALRGSLLSVKRLCRCHPFHPGGFDPPPPPRRAPEGPHPLLLAVGSESCDAANLPSAFDAGQRAPSARVSQAEPRA